MNALLDLPDKELIAIVTTGVQWEGTENDGNIDTYQAEGGLVFAAALILVAKEILSNRLIMSADLSQHVFFSILRYYDADSLPTESGMSMPLISTLISRWKVVHSTRNLSKGRQQKS